MSTGGPPQIINIHTPANSYAIIHSLQQDTFQNLISQLTKKETVSHTQSTGSISLPLVLQVKYEWNETVWNLDDESDYSIFVWRYTDTPSPTLHVRNLSIPLPSPTSSEYSNPSYYLLRPPPPPPKKTVKKTGTGSVKSAPGGTTRTKKSQKHSQQQNGDGVPAHKKEFEKFHSENGVRTVIGSVGPVKGVRMLLKSGYRHVYISRPFAARSGFIPADATPGHYGYTGIIHIGTFPITLPPSNTTTHHPLYLTEEPHFDVILGRAFIEKRGVEMDVTDMTSVRCRDTGEKLEIEVVVLRDGRGEVVTVT